MENIKILKRRKTILSIMKNLLYLIPTGLITSNIIISKYGGYEYTSNVKDMNFGMMVIAITIFCLIFIVTYFLERTILPFILIQFDKKMDVKSKSFQKGILSSDKILKRQYPINPFTKIKGIKNKNLLRLEITQELMSFPMIIILFLIAFNNIWAYISIVIVLIITWGFYKYLNAYFYLYGLKDESNTTT